MVRNFRIVKDRPFRPILFCRNKTGPRDVKRTARPVKRRTGSTNGKEQTAQVTSNQRFCMDCDHQLAGRTSSSSKGAQTDASSQSKTFNETMFLPRTSELSAADRQEPGKPAVFEYKQCRPGSPEIDAQIHDFFSKGKSATRSDRNGR
jgi:hypothetical protein